jgi:hypothetical protein
MRKAAPKLLVGTPYFTRLRVPNSRSCIWALYWIAIGQLRAWCQLWRPMSHEVINPEDHQDGHDAGRDDGSNGSEPGDTSDH